MSSNRVSQTRADWRLALPFGQGAKSKCGKTIDNHDELLTYISRTIDPVGKNNSLLMLDYSNSPHRSLLTQPKLQRACPPEGSKSPRVYLDIFGRKIEYFHADDLKYKDEILTCGLPVP